MKKKELTYDERLKLEYKKAIDGYHEAFRNFRYADANYVDVAIADLRSAELALDAIVKKLKIYKESNSELRGQLGELRGVERCEVRY